MNQAKNQFSLADSETSGFEQKPASLDLTKQQKISLISLGIFTVLIIGFGIFQFQYNLYSPFDYKKIIAAGNNNNNSNAVVATTTDLTKLDSDGDGLSDYDEINIYGTSPYLEDSDSDGFLDKEEILNGTDPNCPAGQACTQVTANNGTSTPTAAALNNINAEDQAAKELLSGNTEPSVLRKLLLDNGMSKTELDQISDEDLVASYQDTLRAQAEAQAAKQ